MAKIPVGTVHGRFQILHNGHMDYILTAKAACDFLVVGITNPDPTQTAFNAANPHRSLPGSNPFSYYERAIMARESLLEQGVPLAEFMMVPMPINKPELIRNYVPTDATFYLTVFDEWGRTKVRTLESLALKTVVLYERPLSEKYHNSSDIRRKIAAGQPWEGDVPRAVARYIKDNRLDARIVALLNERQES